MRSFLLGITLVLLSSPSATFACTYGEAQTKFIEFNNMLQVYNREMAGYIQRNEEIPVKLVDKLTAMAEESAEIGMQMEAVYENNNNIQSADTVDAEICSGFDALMAKHAPASYSKTPVLEQQVRKNPSCDSEKLWDRYGKAIQKQSELTTSGAITKQENGKYMELMTLLGQYSTTDISKACDAMDQIEKKLDSE